MSNFYKIISESIRKVLLESEQDDLYFKTYRENDVDTAMRMVMQAAKMAMPNSDAVDENGEPIAVYHGTDEPFTVFDMRKTADTAFWFSSGKKKIIDGESGAASRNAIISAYLNITNIAGWDEYERYGIDELERLGFDGIRLDDDYVVFYPNQIKSADPFTFDDNGNLIPLSQRFDFSKNDIRY